MTLRAMLTRARLRSALLPAATWVWTRGVLLLYVYDVLPYISHGDITGDLRLYNHWSNILTTGHFPQADRTWQYPPGAALVIGFPRLIRSLTGLSYNSAFYAMALASDLIIFLLVLYRCWRTHEETGSERVDYLGAYAYVAAIFMLGPFIYGRYDITVTMIASVGLVVALNTAASTWRLRGAAIGLGSIVKVWPMALVLGLPRGRNGRLAVLWGVIGGAVPTLLLLIMPGALSFLKQQGGRGLEIESVLATPFLMARHFGYHAVIRNRYGSWEVIGPGIGAIAAFCELLTLLGFCWLLWWRVRAKLTPERWTEGVYYDASLVAVMISIITSRVLSPQYLVWVCGLLALCLAIAPLKKGGTVLTGPCWLLLGTISLTQLEFPLLFPTLVHGGTKAALFVTGRNALLVGATIWSAYLLWKRYAVVEEKAPEIPEPEADREPEPAI
ncbi:MAG TPA: glycosyltransferase family 87 protein [Actinospica sp.]|nr:glycosyltransferase family 87 protein [Actinospica sp.]